MRKLLLVLSLCSFAACGGSEPPPGSSSELTEGERPDEPGSTRASREAAREVVPTRSDRVEGEAPVPPATTDRPLVVAHPIDADEGEDGRGATIAATRPVAIDLDARRFPPRALDPVLNVGELRFVHYTHPQPGVLRFVVADRALLPEGAEVAVQYGDDAASRVVVAPALEVTP